MSEGCLPVDVSSFSFLDTRKLTCFYMSDLKLAAISQNLSLPPGHLLCLQLSVLYWICIRNAEDDGHSWADGNCACSLYCFTVAWKKSLFTTLDRSVEIVVCFRHQDTFVAGILQNDIHQSHTFMFELFSSPYKAMSRLDIFMALVFCTCILLPFLGLSTEFRSGHRDNNNLRQEGNNYPDVLNIMNSQPEFGVHSTLGRLVLISHFSMLSHMQRHRAYLVSLPTGRVALPYHGRLAETVFISPFSCFRRGWVGHSHSVVSVQGGETWSGLHRQTCLPQVKSSSMSFQSKASPRFSMRREKGLRGSGGE